MLTGRLCSMLFIDRESVFLKDRASHAGAHPKDKSRLRTHLSSSAPPLGFDAC